MKSLANDRRIAETKVECPVHESKNSTSNSNKRLEEIKDENLQCQKDIEQLEKQIAAIKKETSQMDKQINEKKLEFEDLKNNMEDQEEKEQEGEEEMGSWINKMQNYSGCPPELIESLLCMEFEGSPDDHEICLSCYQEIKLGVMCKYLPCSHIFHQQCIDNHLKVNTLCPGCGEPVAM